MKGYYFITDASLSRRGNLSDVKSAVSTVITRPDVKCEIEKFQRRMPTPWIGS